MSRAATPSAVPSWLAALLATWLASACGGHQLGDRDYERLALQAEDVQAQTRRVAECEQTLAANRGEQAVACYARAVEVDPYDTHAVHGLTRALLATGRDVEARAAAERRLADLKAGKGDDVADPAAAKALVELLLYSYARHELYTSALDRIAALGAPTLDQAADQFPVAYGLLREAQRLATKGRTREALDKYSEWLVSYGVPDSPLLRQWSDAVLAACAPHTADYLGRGDREAEAKNWIGAVVSYSEVFRYWPSETFERNARRKLIEASAYLADPSMLSPTAADVAAAAVELVQKNEVGAALRASRRAVAAAPYWADARYDLAVLFAAVEMYGEAVRQIDWFLALDPTSSRAAQARTLRGLWVSWQQAQSAGSPSAGSGPQLAGSAPPPAASTPPPAATTPPPPATPRRRE